MSSRLHNKWHRHNHHTNATPDENFPDSAHDPIASPESPFQGTFALNGELSAAQKGIFTGNVALVLRTDNLGLSTNGGMVADGSSILNAINVNQITVTSPSRTFLSEVRHAGKYLEVIIDNQSYYIPLWLG